MGGEQRRDDRFRVRLPASLTVGKTQIALHTEDVGFRGVFLRTDSPPGWRQLVRLRLVLPPNEDFTCHGMAVHVLRVGEAGARTPGVGVQFYALDERLRRRWTAFVQSLQLAAKQPSGPFPTVPEEPIRRKGARWPAKFVVRVRSTGDLHTFTTRDVSRAGMFLRTTERFEIGTHLFIAVVHGELPPMCFDARVRRHAAPTEAPGLGVELIKADPTMLDKLVDLAAQEIDGPEFVTEYDPRLE